MLGKPLHDLWGGFFFYAQMQMENCKRKVQIENCKCKSKNAKCKLKNANEKVQNANSKLKFKFQIQI